MTERDTAKMRFKDYIKLYQSSRVRKESAKDYHIFQEFQGKLLIRFFNQQNVLVRGTKILDLGSGLGGYSSALEEAGANVVALDLEDKILRKDFPFVHASAIDCPFEANSFDRILCASLIEHVPVPKILAEKILRLLRPGGIAYISFSPFYSPMRGHQFSPFHLLGERIALKVAQKRKLYDDSAWLNVRYSNLPSGYQVAYGNWGLYPRTIRQVDKILKEFSCDVLDRSTRWLPIDFSGIPILGEFLTWHVQFLLRKT